MLLMEAILHDPIVDWTPHREDAAAGQVSPPLSLQPTPPWKPLEWKLGIGIRQSGHPKLAFWGSSQQLPSMLQAMEMGVQLNLLCSRLDEVTPELQAFVSGFQASLSASREGMDNFLQAFLPALDAATVAHTANADAQKAQVTTPLCLHEHSMDSCSYDSGHFHHS